MQTIKLERSPSTSERHAAKKLEGLRKELRGREDALTAVEKLLRPLRAEVANLEEQANAAALGAEESGRPRDIEAADKRGRSLTRVKGKLNELEVQHAEVLLRVDDLATQFAEAKVQYQDARRKSDAVLEKAILEAGEAAVAEIGRLSVEVAKVASAQREADSFLFDLRRKNGARTPDARIDSGNTQWRINRRTMSARLVVAMLYAGLDGNPASLAGYRQWLAEQLEGKEAKAA